MSINKQDLIKKFQRSATDTGSPEVQVAILTDGIKTISEHVKRSPKDLHCKRGLLKQVSLRKSLLRYLKGKSPERYKALITELGLRG